MFCQRFQAVADEQAAAKIEVLSFDLRFHRRGHRFGINPPLAEGQAPKVDGGCPHIMSLLRESRL
jgi:hypothetical protein